MNTSKEMVIEDINKYLNDNIDLININDLYQTLSNLLTMQKGGKECMDKRRALEMVDVRLAKVKAGLLKARISGDEEDDNFTELEFYDKDDNIDFILNYKKNKPCFQLLIIGENRYLFKHLYRNKNSTNIEIHTKGELVLDTWDKEFNNHIKKAAEELISTFAGDEVVSPVEEDVSATNELDNVNKAILDTSNFVNNEKKLGVD